MAYTYMAFIQYKDVWGRFANPTTTPTVTAYKSSDGTTIAGATLTNIATGLYKAAVSHTALEQVLFRVVPADADKPNFEDIAVMADEVRFDLDDTANAIKGTGWTNETLVALMNATENTLESLSNEIATKMATAENIEGTYTLKDAIRIILAFAAGKVSGGGTTSIKFRSMGDDVDRIQATVDSSGNRTAVTINPNDPV